MARRTISKTKYTVQAELQIARNYGNISKSTGITSKRFSELRKGEKPTRSEVSKISAYGRKEKDVSLTTISRFSGFTPKEIQGRMKYLKKKKTTGHVGVFRQSMTVENLKYSNNGIITGKRRNGTKVIYYVIVIEDLRDGKTVVGHGFKLYDTWLKDGSPMSKTKEVPSTTTGEIYVIETTYYSIIGVPGLAEFVRNSR